MPRKYRVMFFYCPLKISPNNATLLHFMQTNKKNPFISFKMTLTILWTHYFMYVCNKPDDHCDPNSDGVFLQPIHKCCSLNHEESGQSEQELLVSTTVQSSPLTYITGLAQSLTRIRSQEELYSPSSSSSL